MLLEDTLAGAGSTATTVLVSGEPGIGKSRMVAEFCGRAAANGWLVAVGGCSPVVGHDLPYGGVVSVLRSLAREVGDDAVEPALRTLGVFGIASVPARPDAGELGRTWLFETILEQVSAVSTAPAWYSSSRTCSGPITRRWVSSIISLATWPSAPFCWSARVGRRARSDGALRTFAAELARGANVRRVELAGLDRAALAVMAADILGAAVPADRLDAVERLAGGNPFFAEELLAAGDLTVVPSGLRDVVMAGVEQVSPAARQALARHRCSATP